MSVGIAAADIVSQLRRRFGTRGVTDIALDETVLPTINLGDLDGPPWHFKQGFICSFNQAAVAAQFSYIALNFAVQNAAPGAVAVVRHMWISSAAVGQQVRVGVVSASRANALAMSVGSPGGSWDTTETDDAGSSLQPAPAISVGGTTNAGTILGAQESLELYALANTPIYIPVPFCVRRGGWLLVQGRTVNVQMIAAFYGDIYQPE